MSESENTSNEAIAALTALNERVAKLAGWRAVDLNDNPHGLKVRGPNWKLIAPDGSEQGWGWNEMQAWEHADVPDYVHDLNAAATLGIDLCWTVMRKGGKAAALCSDDDYTRGEASHGDEAMARTLAWLDYDDRRMKYKAKQAKATTTP